MKLPLTLPLDSYADRKVALIRRHDGTTVLQIAVLSPEEEAALNAWLPGLHPQPAPVDLVDANERGA